VNRQVIADGRPRMNSNSVRRVQCIWCWYVRESAVQ